ncbi:hypothetical protein EJ02DRAFT_441918 [Clathrospora elynae]|uniref:Uncharacterized protein n=1 Tax=Clathrospora elynae TaxID=706981 RepID=A0A6A5SZY6_9PLEO|nr:hypothetical protein EJ02DRAFT_441918 [Clathrospora elynae]
MSSCDSNKSGYFHPQYHHQAPPYPTSPAPLLQQQGYFSPIPEQQQPIYFSSPTQAFYSTSPTSHPGGMATPQPQATHRRRTSSTSSYNSQRPTQAQLQQMPLPMPIPLRQPNPASYQYPAPYSPPVTYGQQQPVYMRSTSHQNQHMHDPHAYADGEDKFEEQQQLYHGRLDPATEREYERRYAREKALERRPTLGGSLLNVVSKVGKVLGGERR